MSSLHTILLAKSTQHGIHCRRVSDPSVAEVVSIIRCDMLRTIIRSAALVYAYFQVGQQSPGFKQTAQTTTETTLRNVLYLNEL